MELLQSGPLKIDRVFPGLYNAWIPYRIPRSRWIPNATAPEWMISIQAALRKDRFYTGFHPDCPVMMYGFHIGSLGKDRFNTGHLGKDEFYTGCPGKDGFDIGCLEKDGFHTGHFGKDGFHADRLGKDGFQSSGLRKDGFL